MRTRASIRVTPDKRKRLEDALALIEAHVASVAEVWDELTPTQRDALIAHSPVLARIVAIGGAFSWRP